MYYVLTSSIKFWKITKKWHEFNKKHCPSLLCSKAVLCISEWDSILKSLNQDWSGQYVGTVIWWTWR